MTDGQQPDRRLTARRRADSSAGSACAFVTSSITAPARARLPVRVDPHPIRQQKARSRAPTSLALIQVPIV